MIPFHGWSEQLLELLRMALLLSEIKKCCSVTQSYPTLCDYVGCNTPGFPVFYHILELAQTHVHWVSDAIQQYWCLSSPFSSSLQSYPASGSFPKSWLFASSGQSIGASASCRSRSLGHNGGWGSWLFLDMLNLRCTLDFYMEIASGSWVKSLEFMLKIFDFESP